ncbi:Aspartate/glutamate/uridylate kinase [Phycomyces nitens]|nr:Aspartate/glutamate/uridylate kinase [Phycomyces nitens]
MKTVIIKLGGAALTNKRSICELASESDLKLLLDQLQAVYHSLQRSGDRLVLIHGAGSFGHPQAKKHRIKQGWQTHASAKDQTLQKQGFANLRQNVLQLHVEILAGLQARGIPVVSQSPFDYITTENGSDSPARCFQSAAHRANELMDLDLVPLLHGDAVLDRVLGCTILSGDVVMHHLAQLLPHVIRCVFITDVAGVYDADPKLVSDRVPRLIPLIDPSKTQGVNVGLVEREVCSDVTGGMDSKVKWASKTVIHADRANRPLEVAICKAGSYEAQQAMSLAPLVNNGTSCPELKMTIFRIPQLY